MSDLSVNGNGNSSASVEVLPKQDPLVTDIEALLKLLVSDLANQGKRNRAAYRDLANAARTAQLLLAMRDQKKGGGGGRSGGGDLTYDELIKRLEEAPT